MKFVLPKDYDTGFTMSITGLRPPASPLPRVPRLPLNRWVYGGGHWHCNSNDFIHFKGWPKCPCCYETTRGSLHKSSEWLVASVLDRPYTRYHRNKHICGAEVIFWDKE